MLSLSHTKCCVPGCFEARDASHPVPRLHLFPNPKKDPERFEAWRLSVGGHILELSNEHIYKCGRVCHAHFEEKFHCRYGRLSNIAIPTLNLAVSDGYRPIKSPLSSIENVGDCLPSTSKESSHDKHNGTMEKETDCETTDVMDSIEEDVAETENSKDDKDEERVNESKDTTFIKDNDEVNTSKSENGENIENTSDSETLNEMENSKDDKDEERVNESKDTSFIKDDDEVNTSKSDNGGNIENTSDSETLNSFHLSPLDVTDSTEDDGTSPKNTSSAKKDDGDFDADGTTVHRKSRLRRTEPVVNKEKTKDTPERKRKHSDNDGDDGSSHICSECKKKFDTKKELFNHMRQVHKDSFTCALCEAKFETNAQLIKHKVKHDSEDRAFLCNTCKMAFTDHCDFLIHEISHTYRSKYKCVECNTYQNKNFIKTHIQSHFNKKLQCDQCEKLFNTEPCLKKHITELHIKKIECVECGQIFKGSSAYETHLTTHTGVKRFQCLYCGEGFSHNQARNNHTRQHTKEKPYECDVCHQTFYQKTEMKRHRKKHNEGTILECDYCGRKYNSKQTLRQHIKLHN